MWPNEEIDEGLFLLGWDARVKNLRHDITGLEGHIDGISILMALGSTSLTSTPPSWVKRIVDTDVVFGVGRVGKERLDNKVVQDPCDGPGNEMKTVSLKKVTSQASKIERERVLI